MKNLQNDFDNLTNPDSNKPNFIKKEFEHYLEFHEFELKKDESPNENNISFYPVNLSSNSFKKKSMPTLSAKSSLNNSIKKHSSFFMVSDSDDIALRITSDSKGLCYVNVISEIDFTQKNYILYAQELDKYFIPTDENEFYLGLINEDELSNLKIKIIFPIEEIRVKATENNFISISKKDMITVKNSFLFDNNLHVSFQQQISAKLAIIFEKRMKEIFFVKNNSIMIPKYYLSSDFTLLFY